MLWRNDDAKNKCRKDKYNKPTKASDTLNQHTSRSLSKSSHQLLPRQQQHKCLLTFVKCNKNKKIPQAHRTS